MNATAQWAGMLREATTWVLPVIFAVTFHEAAHGFVARWLGDDTAWREGRVSFNPLKHIDPFGTVVLPALLFVTSGFLFGYAKPVPVNFARLNNPRRDSVFVALAGPGTNVLLAIASALLFYVLAVTPAGAAEWLAGNLVNSLQINAVLCVFNMLPVPPLDGHRVLGFFLPEPVRNAFYSFGQIGIVLLIVLMSHGTLDPVMRAIYSGTDAVWQHLMPGGMTIFGIGS